MSNVVETRWHYVFSLINLLRQADQLLTEQANERDEKRLEKTRADKTYAIAVYPPNGRC